jgi:hypothetical protein
MNIFKKTLGLLGILAGLVLVILLINFISNRNQKKGDLIFGKFNPEKSGEISIVARWNTTKLIKTPVGWVVATADSFPADTSEINKVMAAFQGMSARELVSSNPEKQQLFQVDSLAGVRVKVITQDRDTMADVMVGKNGADYNSTYFRPAHGKNVYLYDQNLRYLFSKNSTNWRDTYVLKMNPENASMLTLEYPGETLELIKDNQGTWKITKPQGAEAKQNLVNEMVNAVTALSSKDMQRLNMADTSYGFNRSPCTVTVGAKNGNRFVLLFGAYNETGKEYSVKNNFRNYVYKINDNQAIAILRHFEEIKAEVNAEKKAEGPDKK